MLFLVQAAVPELWLNRRDAHRPRNQTVDAPAQLTCSYCGRDFHRSLYRNNERIARHALQQHMRTTHAHETQDSPNVQTLDEANARVQARDALPDLPRPRPVRGPVPDQFVGVSNVGTPEESSVPVIGFECGVCSRIFEVCNYRNARAAQNARDNHQRAHRSRV